MKCLVFDAGPLISMTTNNLLWVLEPLKKSFDGEFIIPESVKGELIDEPLQTKKFRFEALQMQEYFTKGVLSSYEDDWTKEETLQLLNVANSCFSTKGKNMRIVHYGEIASVITALKLDASALVMDERVTRELIEHPTHLAKIMEKKLHLAISINEDSLSRFREKTASLKIIRSTELAAIAFEKGLLDRYAIGKSTSKAVLESILWGLKLNGCAINERGIKAILEAESK